MKKIPVLLSGIMLFALASCGTAADTGSEGSVSAQNEITELISQGYSFYQFSADETQWKGVFHMEESYDTVYAVTAEMTAEQYEAFCSIEFDDEDLEEKRMDILGNLQNVTVTDITDMIPTQDELDAYVGQTIGDLENLGFENTGWTGEPETGFTFFYDGPVYSCLVTPEEGTIIEDMDDLSANDVRDLTIGSIEFYDFSTMILDQI